MDSKLLRQPTSDFVYKELLRVGSIVLLTSAITRTLVA